MTINILDQDIVVTIIDDDTIQVNLLNPNQQQQSAIEFQDEGVTLGTVGTVTKVNFIGSSVTASRSGSTINVTISGVGGTPGGTTGQIQYNNAGSFGGFGSWNGSTFALGTLGYSDTGIIASFQSLTNSYNQVVLQNTSNGTTASTNFNVSNDSGTATTNYGEFGINSSGFTGTGSFSQAGYVYLAAATTDLAIGTYGAKAIHFVINSGATDAATITASSNFSIGSSSDLAKLYVNQSTLTSSHIPVLRADAPAHTAIATTTEVNAYDFRGANWTWAAGTIATQRFAYFRSFTVTTGLATNAYGLYVEAPTGNITNAWGLGVAGKASIFADTNTLMVDVTNGAGKIWQKFTSGNGVNVYGQFELQSNAVQYTGTQFKFIFSGVDLQTTQTGRSSAFTPAFIVNPGAHTAVPTGTEFLGLFSKISAQIVTWAAGALAAQRFNYWDAPTIAFASASTVTDLYNGYFKDPIAGSNATATNKWSLGTEGNIRVGGKVMFASANTTGAGSALLGANSPAVTNTAPYTWLTAISSDGSTIYIPAWK